MEMSVIDDSGIGHLHQIGRAHTIRSSDPKVKRDRNSIIRIEVQMTEAEKAAFAKSVAAVQKTADEVVATA